MLEIVIECFMFAIFISFALSVSLLTVAFEFIHSIRNMIGNIYYKNNLDTILIAKWYQHRNYDQDSGRYDITTYKID